MNQTTPKVSVIMSVYNGSRYLQESIDSILNQTLTNFEFIIIDDGSSDNTWEILTEYGNCDRRIKLYKNEENLGLTKSLNKGLKLAQGEYIARQDADDISLPERFEKQVSFLNEQPKVILVSANYHSIDFKGSLSGKQSLAGDSDITAWYLLFYNRIGAHGLAMFRCEPVINIGGYSESYRYTQDYELWSRLVQYGEIVVLPDTLQLYRRNHSESISVSAKPAQKQLALSITKENIEQLTGETLSIEEIADLNNFWIHNYPNSKQVKLLNSNLQKIYQAFLQRRTERGSSNSVLSHQLRIKIGKQYISWLKSLNTRRNLYEKLTISSLALPWHPMGIIKLWLSEVRSVLKRINLLFQRIGSNKQYPVK